MSKYKMRKETARKLHKLILATAVHIESFGRPRKPGNAPRPAQLGPQMDLPTQLAHRAKVYGISPGLRKQAEQLIVEKLTDRYPWSSAEGIKALDDTINDTREIVRALRAVQKDLAPLCK